MVNIFLKDVKLNMRIGQDMGDRITTNIEVPEEIVEPNNVHIVSDR